VISPWWAHSLQLWLLALLPEAVSVKFLDWQHQAADALCFVVRNVRLYQSSALLGHQEEGHEEGPGESRREERSVTGQ
jgi:hypothetical protein